MNLFRRSSNTGDASGDVTEPIILPSRPNYQSFTKDGKPISRTTAILCEIIFTTINFLNYTDRYTVAGVLLQIQDYFQISETQSGLIQTVFIIAYMVWAPIFGYLGDRYTRKYILMAGVISWSFFTLAGSFVQKDMFWLFLLIRGCVGIGEASYVTVSPTMIADLFPESERLKMLSVYSFAAPFGSGFGYILGSFISTGMANSRWSNEEDSWKWSLRVTPILGIILVILTFIFVPEPSRGATEQESSDNQVEITVQTSLKEDLIYLGTNKSVVFATLGFVAVAFVAGSLAFWAPAYIEDAYTEDEVDFDSNTIALGFGLVTCIAGVVGVALGSVAATLYRRVRIESEALVSGLGLLLCAPFVFIAVVWVNSYHFISWTFILLGEIALCLNWALVPKILIETVVPNRRALAAGLSNMIGHLFGDAGSPTLVGVLADWTHPANNTYAKFQGLKIGLLTTPIVSVLGGAAFLTCAYFYEADLRACQKLMEDAAAGARRRRASTAASKDHPDLEDAPIREGSYEEMSPFTPPTSDPILT